jgi:hypothetical protein
MPRLDGAIGPAGRALARAARELARLRRIRGPGRRTARRIARAQLALAAAILAAGPGGEEAQARSPVFVNPLLPFGLADVGDEASPDFADLDGDGDLDALVGNSEGDLLFFENIGTRASPAFGAPLLNPFGLVATFSDLATPVFADIDGDGDLDVFMGSALGQTTFHRNIGSASGPSFDPAVVSGFGYAALHASLAFADLDGDGDLDAVIGDGSGDTFYRQNVGTPADAQFAGAVVDAFGLAGVGSQSSPRFGDLDGDGDLDALIGNEVGDLHFFANTGTVQAPAFAPALTNPFGLGDVGESAAPAVADLDADGDADILAGASSGNVVLFANVGTKAAQAFLGPVPIPEVEGRASPTFGDIDGDGDLDALIGFSLADGGMTLFRNTGTASAPRFEETGVANPAGLVPPVYGDPTPALADLDGDGDLDVVAGSQAGVFTFENTGSALVPEFAAPVAGPAGLEAVFASSPTVADLDADGDLDAFVGNLAGETLHLANTGTAQSPGFAAPTTNPFGLPTLGGSARPSFGDVDGDGDLDFLGGGSAGTLTFAKNRGKPDAPAFAPPVTDPFGLTEIGESTEPAFADVDADGDVDLFVAVLEGSKGRTMFFANLTPLCPATPDADCAAFEAGSLSVDERKAGNEKLTAKLSRGPAIAQAAFGDPTGDGGSTLALCVYDGAGERVAALEVARAGEACGAKPCWKPLGKAPPEGKGFAYKDSAGASAGVRSMKLAGGKEGRSSVAMAASNRATKSERAMADGLAAALADSEEVTLQVQVLPGGCFEARLTEVTKQEPDRFKAR